MAESHKDNYFQEHVSHFTRLLQFKAKKLKHYPHSAAQVSWIQSRCNKGSYKTRGCAPY